MSIPRQRCGLVWCDIVRDAKSKGRPFEVVDSGGEKNENSGEKQRLLIALDRAHRPFTSAAFLLRAASVGVAPDESG